MKKLVALMVLLLALAACDGQTAAEAHAEADAESGAHADEEAVTTETTASADVRVETNTEEVSNDLRALLAAGQSAKCTFTTEGGTVVMYMDGLKQRAEVTAQGMMSYMISDGVTIYSWTGNEGVKYELAAMQKMAAKYQGSSQQQQPQTANDYADVAADVHCSAWTPTSSSFTPPSNVEFQDMAEMMAQMEAMQQMQQQNQMPDY